MINTLKYHQSTKCDANRKSIAPDFVKPHQSSLHRLFRHRSPPSLPLTTTAAAAAPDPWSAFPDDPGHDLPVEYGSPPSAPSKQRRAGVVLHPTSLPGKYGIGEIGDEALAFLDWMAASGLQLWQVLPLVPPEKKYWSPYSGLDALCGNPLLIPLDDLHTLGLLKAEEMPEPQPEKSHADFDAVYEIKTPLLTRAAERLLSESSMQGLREEMDVFRASNQWIEESALFTVLSELPNLKDEMWWDWPVELRDRDPTVLKSMRTNHAAEIDQFIAIQFLFDRCWRKVKAYANSLGISVGGDMPIYVGGQSADVWAYQHLFELTEDRKPALVSGVPPDAFSATGQLWGSPLYDWKAHAAEGYGWWIQRFQRSLSLYDETRVDHFRAFAGYWAVDADEETAMNGKWKRGPGVGLFDALEAALGEIPILAEDLGVITPDVVELREEILAPGMCVLQFAWGGGPSNTHLPHNVYENCFVYPGTHDNQTALGWWKQGATPSEKTLIRKYLGMTGDDISWAFIHSAYTSVARTAVSTLQDVMRLDDGARMNTPGKAGGNWNWRVGGSGVWQELEKEAGELWELADKSDRLREGMRKRGRGRGRSGQACFR
jgi:4-alpha-glucanotransferase